MRIQTGFSDAKFMSAKEKEMVFKKFRKVIDKRDISLMDRRLYKHLHLHCSFIAHYNINGFKEEYSGSGFRRFVEHFDANAEINSVKYLNTFWMNTAEYQDINTAMVEYVTKEAPKIYQEMGIAQEYAEMELLHALAEKHGLAELARKTDTSDPGFEQLSFFADA